MMPGMFSRPGVRSAVLLAGTWMLGAAIAISIGYFAIDRVGRDVHDDATLVASSGTASAPPPSSTGPSSPPPTTSTTATEPARTPDEDNETDEPPPATPPPAGTTTSSQSSRRFEVTGGVVAVRCDGTAITLLYAYPDDGFTAHVDPGATSIEVEFASRSAVSHVKLRCAAGQPVANTEDDEHEDGE